ncbi:MAG TPA: PaaI family thioesterase [Anaeromyxobacteraceae bacterium]|nr:PaaI family thioesterase [Anaeromyxobacteraceae bacterium]
MTDLRRFFRRDRFAALAGARLVEVRPGLARARLRVGARHLNAVGVAQGGAIFTLADLAFAAACNSHGTVAVAVNASISFVKAAGPGWLQAEAREVSLSPRLSSVTVHVRERGGALVAVFQGLAYRKKETLDQVPPVRRPRPPTRGRGRGKRPGRR